MEKEELQVGDVVYTYNQWHGLQRHIIERVTAKQAFSGYMKFKREIEQLYRGKGVKNIGQYGSADVETEKIKAEYEEQVLRSKLGRTMDKIKTKELPLSTVKKLLEILTDGKI